MPQSPLVDALKQFVGVEVYESEDGCCMVISTDARGKAVRQAMDNLARAGWLLALIHGETDIQKMRRYADRNPNGAHGYLSWYPSGIRAQGVGGYVVCMLFPTMMQAPSELELTVTAYVPADVAKQERELEKALAKLNKLMGG